MSVTTEEIIAQLKMIKRLAESSHIYIVEDGKKTRQKKYETIVFEIDALLRELEKEVKDTQ